MGRYEVEVHIKGEKKRTRTIFSHLDNTIHLVNKEQLFNTCFLVASVSLS